MTKSPHDGPTDRLADWTEREADEQTNCVGRQAGRKDLRKERRNEGTKEGRKEGCKREMNVTVLF